MVIDNKLEKIADAHPKFESRIESIPISNIEININNPRKKFGQEEEDDLIESINSRGILVPIIVYQKTRAGKSSYVILDGQRRVQACKKLGISEISAHIITKEPTKLENLSLMFHIHNVHEDWTDVAIVDSIEQIIDELKLDKNNLTNQDVTILKKWTSLSQYKIDKYRDLLKYPDNVLTLFRKSELKETPDLDLDLLSELRVPLNQLERVLPELAKEYSEDKVVKIMIGKKQDKVLTTNKEIRKISKMITNAKRKTIRIELVRDKLKEFFDTPATSISQIYSETAEPIEQVKNTLKMISKLRIEIENLDTRKLTNDEKIKLKQEFKELVRIFRKKISG